MKTISMDAVQPGMVLASDVKSSDGRLLLPGGVELKDTHVALLRRLAVPEIQVEEACGVDEALLAEAEAHVKNFFLYVDHGNEALQAMYDIALEETALAMAKGWTPPRDEELHGDGPLHEDQFYRGEGVPQDIVKAEVEVASFPDTYFHIKKLLDSGTASAEDVARAVGMDLGLTTRLLKLVNSPFYGLSRRIDSLSRAVAMVGGRELSTMAMGISAIGFFKEIPPELIDMRGFWRHSISCGIIAKLLASHAGMDAPERFFIGGLLHDVGRLIMFKRLPCASVEALRYARGAFVPLVDAETEVMGFDHAELGKALLEEWKFPEPLVHIVADHHHAGGTGDKRDASVVCAADNLANALAIARGAMFVLPGMPDGTWESLGLPAATITEVVREHGVQEEELLATFLD